MSAPPKHLGAVVTTVFVLSGILSADSLEAERSDRGDSPFRAAFDLSVHRARQDGNKPSQWRMSNPANGLSGRFTPEGMALEVSSPGKTQGPRCVEWRTVSLGYGENLRNVETGTVAVNPSAANRIELRHAGFIEWYVNRKAGLEHGYTLHERPAGANGETPLRILMAVTGDLEATVAEDGGSVILRDGGGREVVRYGKLLAWDAEGRTLEAQMVARRGGLEIHLDESGAVYPVTIDPIFTQQAYLKASNTGDGDLFGFSVAIDGDTAVVGAPSENGIAADSGAAYVFFRDGGAWSEQGYLKASNAGITDEFGTSVAVSGNTVVVGAPLENGGAADAGAAYVFVRTGTTWSQQAILKASNAGFEDKFGTSVSVSGDTVLVGAPFEDSNATGVDGTESNNDAGSAGAAYAFLRTGSTWAQQAYFKASNTGSGDQFGFSVVIDADTAVIGANHEDGDSDVINAGEGNNDAGDAGAAYVFTRSGTIWIHRAYLKAVNSDANDDFGFSVSLSNDTIAVGAPGEDSDATDVNGNPNNNFPPYETSGAAYVFTGSGATWAQQAYVKASNPEETDNFGRTLSVDGNALIVGAYLEDSDAEGINGDGNSNGAPSSGAAYVYLRDGTTWTREAYLKASNTGGGDFFGHSVAVSSPTFIVGAYGEDSAASGVDGSQISEGSPNSGAAYVIEGVGDEFGPRDLWGAGVDLSANETADTVEEQDGVNASATAWSYGTRATAGGTSLTVFVPAQHQNGAGHADLDGWAPNAAVLVNRGSTEAVATLTGETTVPVLPNQIILKPVTGIFPVVRWTAPDNGTYNITARWIDLDDDGGTGAVGHLLVNGVSVMGSGGLRWPDGGGAEFPPKSFRLTAGDVVDFTVGNGTATTGDLTAFNAVIRRAPDFSISAPATITVGDPLTVTVTAEPGTTLNGVALRVNGVPTATDVTEPYQFVLPDLPLGEHQLQADGVDVDQVLGASNTLDVTVEEAAPSPEESSDAEGEGPLASAPTGSVYDCILPGLWSEPSIWERRGDNANGVPGPNDVAFIENIPVALSGDVEVGSLYCRGSLLGENGIKRELTVNHIFSLGGIVKDLDIVIPAEGTFSVPKTPSQLDNVNLTCQGHMVVSRLLYGLNSEVICGGSLQLLSPPANAGPTYLRVESLTLNGPYFLGAGTGLISNGIEAFGAGQLTNMLAPGFYGANGADLVGNNGNSLIGQDGGSLLGDVCTSIIGENSSGLVGNNGNSLIGQDGGSLIGQDGGSLIGQDGGSVIGQNGGNLVGNNGNSLIGQDGGSLIGQDGGSLGSFASPFVFAGAIPGPSEEKSGEAPEEAPAPGLILTGGSLRGSGAFFGSVRNSGGNLSLGRAGHAGLMKVVGDFTQEAGGKLIQKIGGTSLSPLRHDVLLVTDEAILGGELVVDTLNGFVSQPGDNLKILRYGSRSGAFSRVSSNSSVAFGADGMTAEVDGPAPNGVPVLRLTAAPVRVVEGRTAVFMIEATPGTERPVSVNFGVVGKAKRGRDYTLNPASTAFIPVGQNSVNVSLKTKRDALLEKSETATMSLTPGAGYTIGTPGSASVKIINVKVRPK